LKTLQKEQSNYNTTTVSEIKHLVRKQIDTAQWDKVIEQSNATLPYAFSWYLDVVAPGWEALVSDDYKTVLPLPTGKKLGLKYIYQPFHCQQLGLYGQVDEEIILLFLKAIKSSAPYIDYNFNYSNKIMGVDIVMKNNYVLALEGGAEMLNKGFSENLVRNIKKAAKAKITTSEWGFPAFLQFYLSNNTAKEGLKAKHEQALQRLWWELNNRGMAKIYCSNSIAGQPLAAAFIIIYRDRIINIINTSTMEGKQQGGMHLLLSTIIKQNAGKNLVFDFEGSSLQGIARFYQSFGAENQPYPYLKANVIRSIRQRLGV
jgi:hypothetical protein